MFQRQHSCWKCCNFRLSCESQWLLHVAPPSTSSQAKHYCSACAALRGKDRIRYSLTWPPVSFSLGPREASSASVSMSGSIPLCQACEHCRSVHFVQSQEMAVLLKVRVCETDTFFLFLFSLFWGFFSLPSPSSPYTFPGPLPRTTPVPFSPTKGTKSFFYRPTGCSGYKEVKLTMWRCNSPLQAGLDESQK